VAHYNSKYTLGLTRVSMFCLSSSVH